MDPDKIEAALMPRATAIMPVHVFGVEVNGKSILNTGDLSMLSFHTTKVYNTVEGGAMIMHDEKANRE